jgi:pyruvate/2-oxoglutarate dehydrogenase complex dihydrolipoamide acyltransferase (E2) component
MPRFVPLKAPSAFRILAAASWRAPNDPTVLGMIDVEYSAAAAFIARYDGLFGTGLTPTHLVSRAAGLLMRRYPEANAVIHFASIKLRRSADVFIMIDNDNGANLTGRKLEAVDGLALAEIERRLRAGVTEIRAGHDADFGKGHETLRRTPLWLARPLTRVFSFAANRLGFDLSPMGPPPDAFGGVIVTSLAKFGFETGFPALVPVSEAGFMVALMKVRQMPWVVGDKVEPRPVLRICCTTDHRIIDGAIGGLLLHDLKAMLSDPEQLLTEAERALWRDDAQAQAPASD